MIDTALFMEERNEALLSLDKTKIDAYCEKYGAQMPKNEDVFWLGVHKAITGITNLSQDDRAKQLQSVKWLLSKGYEHFMKDITPDELIQIAME